MKPTLLWLAPILATLAISALHGADTSTEPISQRDRFLVTVSEYQLGDSVPANASEADILESIRETDAQPTETIRLSVIKDVDCMVQFGRVIPVTVGKTMNREVATRQTQNVQVGTLLKFRMSLDGESVIVKIEFEASRFQGEGSDDSPPDIASASISTSQYLPFAKPCLIGSTSIGDTSYVFVTVTKIP
jgi:hypothetical protein